jgi:hypothetical protein
MFGRVSPSMRFLFQLAKEGETPPAVGASLPDRCRLDCASWVGFAIVCWFFESRFVSFLPILLGLAVSEDGVLLIYFGY